MNKKSINEIEEKYDLELDRIVKEVLKLKKKSPVILLQFPDGMKIYATAIVDELKNRLGNDKIEFRIWLGSCFGACDVPKSESDLIIQFGHSPWGK